MSVARKKCDVNVLLKQISVPWDVTASSEALANNESKDDNDA